MNVNGESTSEINIKADCDLVLGKPKGLWQEKLTFCFKRNVCIENRGNTSPCFLHVRSRIKH